MFANFSISQSMQQDATRRHSPKKIGRTDVA